MLHGKGISVQLCRGSECLARSVELSYSPALLKRLLEQERQGAGGGRRAKGSTRSGSQRAALSPDSHNGLSWKIPVGRQGQSPQAASPHRCRGCAGAGRRLQELLGHVWPVGAGCWIQAAPQASPSLRASRDMLREGTFCRNAPPVPGAASPPLLQGHVDSVCEQRDNQALAVPLLSPPPDTPSCQGPPGC